MTIDFGPSTQLIEALKTVLHSHLSLWESIDNDVELGYSYTTWRPEPSTLIKTFDLKNHPWVAAHTLSDAERIKKGIGQIWFAEGQDPCKTLTFPGIASASDKTIDSIIAVNLARAAFKKCVVDIKQKHKRMTDNDIASEIDLMGWRRRDSFLREVFSQIGMGRLCLKQIYRPIPYINTLGLSYAQYYFKHKLPIVKTTVSEQLVLIAKRLEKSPSNELLYAYRKLQSLSKDMPIAAIKNSSQIITVNLKSTTDNDEVNRFQRTGVLPIFYSASVTDDIIPHDMGALDEYTNGGSKKRKRRQDKVIDDEPLIYAPGVRLHAYKGA